MSTDWIGAGVPIGLILTLIGIVFYTRMPSAAKLVIAAGLLLRIVGAILRYVVLFAVYHGNGDAVVYFTRGLELTQLFWQGDINGLLNLDTFHGEFAGTNFMQFPSAAVLMITGPSMLGEFIMFSLISFAGLACFVTAYRRTFPNASPWGYAAWVFLFPSLWYWPSSVGKEAFLMLGFGMAALGYAGDRGRVRWLPLATGALIVLATRPELAVILLVAFVLAQWITNPGRWSAGRVLQAAVIVCVGSVGIFYTTKMVGIASLNVDEVQTFVGTSSSRTLGGGSAIESVSLSPLGLPQALVNVLMRPFPWDSKSPLVLASSAEIVLLWVIIFFRRKRVAEAFRQLRTHRLLTLAVTFIPLYALALGFFVNNLGVIARQRVFLLPFLFAIIESQRRVAAAAPAQQTVPIQQRRPVQVPQQLRRGLR